MTWIYDADTDILTITYGRHDTSLLRSIESGRAVLDVDGHGGAVRVRFFHASQRCPAAVLKSLDSPPNPREDILTLTEAANQLGVKPFALRHEILAGGMPAARMNNDWYVRACIIGFYREILDMQGRVVAGEEPLKPGTTPKPKDEPPPEPDRPPG